jgi:citrate lyase gamma subunit
MENRGEEEETIRLREMRAAAAGQCGARGCGLYFGRNWPKLFRSLAAGALEGKALSEKQRADLQEILSTFESVFRQIGNEIEPRLTNNVARLIVDAALIGNYADKKSLALLRAEVGATQAATARKAKRTSDAGKREDLDSAIVAEAKAQNMTLAISEKFARRIRPGVCERLGVGCAENWPEAPTIKSAISRIKKEGKS